MSEHETAETVEAFAFTAENKALADAAIAKYPEGKQRSAVMPLLDIAQRQCGGWLPMPAIEHVATYLDMPAIRVLEVVSFYTMYSLKPVGKNFIQLCGTTPCMLRGSENIMKVITDKLGIKNGETTKDGMFSLLEVECLGACVNAPMVQINDDFYEDLDSDSMAKIINQIQAGETPKTGSQQPGRFTCEPQGAMTTLLDQEQLRAQKASKENA